MSDLSTPQVRLLRVCQRINFGRIEHVVVRAGEPVIDQSTRVVRDVLLDGENGVRKEGAQRDFALRKSARYLSAILSEIDDGVIEVVHVKHGLPFRIELAASAIVD